MAANTQPIFALTPNVSVGNSILTANTALDGTGTVTTIFTAGTNGSRVDQIKIKHTGTAVATVFRVFINNGGTTATASNNSLFTDLTIAANTLAQNAQSIEYVINMNISLPAGYKLTATIGTTVANALITTVIGGDY